MAKEITTRSTRNDILAAYNELLTKINEQKPSDRKAEKLKEDQAKIVESANQHSPEKILKTLGDVKFNIVKMLDELGERLIGEYKKLTDLQHAIEIESAHLNEVYEIKVNADSLAALLQANTEKRITFDQEINDKRNSFEAEITQKRLQWKQEQENFELQKKERDTLAKKEREREEEEYKYNLSLKRKREADEYNVQKTERERVLLEKETAVSERENELALLKKEVESFPAKLEKSIKETEQAVSARLELKYKHETELLSRESDGEKKLTKQVIATLESKIKEQEERIKQLTQKANEAGAQTQAIAIKAIEGASGQRFFGSGTEKTSETNKG